MAVVPSPGVRVTVENPWSVTLAGLVSGVTFGGWNWMRVRQTLWLSQGHAQCIPSQPHISGTVLKESDDLVIFGVTFDSKMTFEKHLCSVSRVASQRDVILRKSWRVFHGRSLLGRWFRGFVLPVLEYCSAVWCSVAVSGTRFLTWGMFECINVHRRSVTVLCMPYKIRCNPVYPLNDALPGPYVPVRLTRCALVAHRYTYAPPGCWTSQCRRTFISLSLSLCMERSC